MREEGGHDSQGKAIEVEHPRRRGTAPEPQARGPEETKRRGKIKEINWGERENALGDDKIEERIKS